MNLIENLASFAWGAEFPRGAGGDLDNVPALVIFPGGSVDIDAWEKERGIRPGAVLEELVRRADVKAAVDLGRIKVPGLTRPLTEAEIKARAEAETAQKARQAAEAERSARESAMEAELVALRARLAEMTANPASQGGA